MSVILAIISLVVCIGSLYFAWNPIREEDEAGEES